MSDLPLKLGFIGCGNMAGAILSSLLKSGKYSAESLYVYDVDIKTKPFAKIGLHIAHCAKDIISQCDVVFIVKPQIYPAVLDEIDGVVNEKQIIVSIAAGISTSYIQKALHVEAKVIRVMPNTPMLVGLGAIALSKAACVDDEAFLRVKNITFQV